MNNPDQDIRPLNEGARGITPALDLGLPTRPVVVEAHKNGFAHYIALAVQDARHEYDDSASAEQAKRYV